MLYPSPIQLLHVYGSIALRVYRVVQKVSDVIPVFGIMSRLPFLFSSASSSAVAHVGHRPAHILALSRPGWPKNFYRVGQKIRIFDNFENVLPYISATVINRAI